MITAKEARREYKRVPDDTLNKIEKLIRKAIKEKGKFIVYFDEKDLLNMNRREYLRKLGYAVEYLAPYTIKISWEK